MTRLILIAGACVIAFSTPAIAGDRLSSGEKLKAGERLASPNGLVTLYLQPTDGNLVLYVGEEPDWVCLWASHKHAVDPELVMQATDGNLVVYSWKQDTTPVVWSADVHNAAGAYLIVQDDGNLVVRNNAGHIFWSLDTNKQAEPLLEVLLAFRLIFSPKIVLPPKAPGPTVPGPIPPKPGPKVQPKIAPTPGSANKMARVGRVVKYAKFGAKGLIWSIPVVGTVWMVYELGKWAIEAYEDEEERRNPTHGLIIANRDNPGPWEAMLPHVMGDDTIAFSFHSGFLCADAGCNKVLANRIKQKQWETFQITHHDDGTISLRAHSTNKYLCSIDGGGGELHANSPTIGPWEKFRATQDETGLMYLQAANGKYLSSQPRVKRLLP